jgi:hypothetical protein
MRPREFIALVGGAASAWPFVAAAQQSPAPKHIGLMANQGHQPSGVKDNRLDKMSYPLHFNLLPSRTGHCGVGISSRKILAKLTMEQVGKLSRVKRHRIETANVRLATNY